MLFLLLLFYNHFFIIMEHKLSPYVLRCYNSNFDDDSEDLFWDGKRTNQYLYLDKINNHDLFDVLAKYLEGQRTDAPRKVSDEKMLFQVSDLTIDSKNRIIHGYIQKGNWGTPGKIFNSANPDEQPRELKNTDAVLLKYFFYFYIPKCKKEAICIFHHIGQYGVKTLFSDSFKDVFINISRGLRLQYNPMQYGNIYEKWSNAALKEIKIRKFKLLRSDVADQLKSISTDFDAYLVIRASRKKPFRISLSGFREKDSIEAKMVEMLEKEHGCQVSGSFELDGHKRVLKVGYKQSISSDIILEEDEINQDNGELDHLKLLKLTKKVVKDIADRIY
ncbi:hypothetical protein A7P99_05380 [Eikenella sp. NML120348]|nr:hypothetical protein A7P99_05380 [Eikenella sp. NML120348]